MKPMLKASGTKRLKLKYDHLFSSFAFNFNLRRYHVGDVKRRASIDQRVAAEERAARAAVAASATASKWRNQAPPPPSATAATAADKAAGGKVGWCRLDLALEENL